MSSTIWGFVTPSTDSCLSVPVFWGKTGQGDPFRSDDRCRLCRDQSDRGDDEQSARDSGGKMTERFGLNLRVVDVGWQGASPMARHPIWHRWHV